MPLDGQYFYRAAVEKRQVRGYLPEMVPVKKGIVTYCMSYNEKDGTKMAPKA
jgi:hypothetical protein